MLDKWTFVKNRQLFFDINPYLNNLQVILRASNRYLKWVSFEKCAKPINGGPTLAGLIGLLFTVDYVQKIFFFLGISHKVQNAQISLYPKVSDLSVQNWGSSLRICFGAG